MCLILLNIKVVPSFYHIPCLPGLYALWLVFAMRCNQHYLIVNIELMVHFNDG